MWGQFPLCSFFNKHAPTKEEQNKALAHTDEQTNYETQRTSINDMVKEQERKLNLLKQLQELEKKEK